MRIRSTVFFSLIFSLGILGTGIAAEGESATGQALAFDRNKGNCLACHAIPGDPKASSPGNIGPALSGMKSRFPDRAKLRAQIWDATVNNPRTSMPPFGKNKVLTEPELDLVTDYIYGI